MNETRTRRHEGGGGCAGRSGSMTGSARRPVPRMRRKTFTSSTWTTAFATGGSSTSTRVWALRRSRRIGSARSRMTPPIEGARAPKATGALRRLPSVHALAQMLPADIPAVWRVEAAQTAIAEARAGLAGGREAEAVIEALKPRARALAERFRAPSLRPVINATGVVLHTNLGRAPLGPEVMVHVAEVAAGYSTLEYDPERGIRGSRHVHVERELVAVTGA